MAQQKPCLLKSAMLRMVLQPGRKLMDRLSLPRKLLVVCAFSLVPFALAMCFLLHELRRDMTFTEKELLGTRYLAQLRQLHERLPKARWLADRLVEGDATVRPALETTHGEIDRCFETLATVDAEIGESLGTTQRFQDLTRSWQMLRELSSRPNLEDSQLPAWYDKACQQIRESIAHVGDSSNLILDPDLETYYLMDVVLLKLPDETALISEVRAAGQEILHSPKPVSAGQSAHLASLAGRIVSTAQATRTSLVDKATPPGGRPSGAPGPEWERSVDEFDGAFARLTGSIERVQSRGLGEESGEFFAAANEAHFACFRLWDRVMPELQGLLQERIDALVRQRTIVVTSTIIGLGMAAYFLLAAYSAALATVGAMHAQARKWCHGDGASHLDLQPRDELGQILQSFDAVVARLQTEANHARREAERAATAEAQARDALADLEDREARLKSVLETAGEGIVTANQDGIVETFNRAAARMLGYAPDEVIGRNLSMLMAPELAPIHDTHIARLVKLPATTTIAAREVIGQRKDGTAIPLRLAVSQVDTPLGRAVTGVFFDLSEQKQLLCDLAQAQRLESVGQLAAGIAHEINTPIQYVGDNARFLKDAFSNVDMVLGTCERIVAAARDAELVPGALAAMEQHWREADFDFLRGEIPLAIEQSLEGISRVAGIVRAMKEFSHPGSHDKVLFNLNEAISTTITVSRNEWKYVAEIETDLDPELPSILGSPGEINQVILNLIVNAAHAIQASRDPASQDKGRITIVSRREENWVEFGVRDTGCGIPEEIRRRVFDPFFTTKGVGKGTGQGLAIARSVVVDKHGGTISFWSEVGKGTAFVIRLPLVMQNAQVEGAPA